MACSFCSRSPTNGLFEPGDPNPGGALCCLGLLCMGGDSGGSVLAAVLVLAVVLALAVVLVLAAVLELPPVVWGENGFPSM